MPKIELGQSSRWRPPAFDRPDARPSNHDRRSQSIGLRTDENGKEWILEQVEML